MVSGVCRSPLIGNMVLPVFLTRKDGSSVKQLLSLLVCFGLVIGMSSLIGCGDEKKTTTTTTTKTDKEKVEVKEEKKDKAK